MISGDELFKMDFSPGSEHYHAVEEIGCFLETWIIEHGYYGHVESNLERELGISGIGKVIDGRTKKVDVQWLVDLALALHVTPNDMLGFSGKEECV